MCPLPHMLLCVLSSSTVFKLSSNELFSHFISPISPLISRQHAALASRWRHHLLRARFANDSKTGHNGRLEVTQAGYFSKAVALNSWTAMGGFENIGELLLSQIDEAARHTPPCLHRKQWRLAAATVRSLKGPERKVLVFFNLGFLLIVVAILTL